MALTPIGVTLTEGGATISTTYSTAPVLPTAKRYLLVAISTIRTQFANPSIPTISGCNQTFVQLGTEVRSTRYRLTLFGCTVNNPSTDTIDFDWGTQEQSLIEVHVWEIDPQDSNYTARLVQSNSVNQGLDTAVTVTLAAFEDGTNGVSTGVALVPNGDSNDLEPGTSFTTMYATWDFYNNRNLEMTSEWRLGDFDTTWILTSAASVAVGAEITWDNTGTGGSAGLTQSILTHSKLTHGRLI